MSYKLVNCEDENEWNPLVENCPDSTAFHQWEVLHLMNKYSRFDLLGKSYQSKLYSLICYKNDQPVCLSPLFYYDTPFLKSVFSPPLKCGALYLGPIMVFKHELRQSRKEDLLFEVHKNIDIYISSILKSNYIKIKTSPGEVDIRHYIQNNYLVEPFYTYEININRTYQEIFDNYDNNTRSSIRRTASRGVTIREGTKNDIILIFNALGKRLREQEKLYEFELDYLLEFCNLNHSKNIKIFVSEKDGEFLTGMILLIHKNRVTAWIGCAKKTIVGASPNDLLMHESIKWAVENNYKIYEILWANTARLNKYKSNFNPKVSIYYSCSKMNAFLAALDRYRKIRSHYYQQL